MPSLRSATNVFPLPRSLGTMSLPQTAGVVALVALLGQDVLRRSPRPQVLRDRDGVGPVQRSAVVALDRRHRSDVTGAQALERAQAKLAIRARAVERRAGCLYERRGELVSTA